MRWHLLVLLGALCALSLQPVQGRPLAASQTLYVAPGGNDSWAGTQATAGNGNGPLRTIQRAVDMATAGTTIRIAAGEYRERVMIRRGGMAGAPITIIGDPGAAIDAGTLAQGWTSAPEVGPGVYKGVLPFKPANMTWNDRYVVRIRPEKVKDGSFRQVLVNGPEGTWSYTKALFAASETAANTVYVKLEGGANPAQQDIVFAPLWGSAITVDGTAHVVIRGMTLKNGFGAVLVTNGASNVTIEGNTLIGGTNTVGITYGANRVQVRNNTITLNYVVDIAPFSRYGWKIWELFRVVGDGVRYGVGFYMAGDYIEVTQNTVRDHFVGIGYNRGGERASQHQSGRHWRITQNTVTTMNGGGIGIGGGAVDLTVADNVVVNTLHALRFQDPTTGPVYVYRNNFLMGQDAYLTNGPTEQGKHHPLFYNYRPTLAQIYVYHNSFSGAGARTFSSANDPNADAPSITSSSNMVWLNNIFSTEALGGLPTGATLDYNLIVESERATGTNVSGSDRPLWNDTTTTLSPAGRSEVLGRGVDVSRPFTLRGKSYGALPGFTTGYFDGARPDLGAIQVGGSAPPLATPPPATSTQSAPPPATPAPPTATQPAATTTPVPPSSAASLNNGGFEAKWAGWQAVSIGTGSTNITSQAARSGGYGALIRGAARIQQDLVGLQPNTTYTLSGYVRSTSTASRSGLFVREYGDSELQVFTSSGQYDLLSITFTTGSSATSASIGFIAPNGDDRIHYADDLVLRLGGAASAPTAPPTATPPPPTATAVPPSGAAGLSNGGFEAKWAGWQAVSIGTGSTNITSQAARSGGYGALIRGAARIQQDLVGLQPNTTYTLSGYVRSTSTASRSGLFVREYGGSELQVLTSSGQYDLLSITFTTGPSATTAAIGFIAPNGDDRIHYADDLALRLGR